MSEHAKGELEVVTIHGIAIGVGVAVKGNGHAMVFSTITNDHGEEDVGEIAANAERLVTTWNRHDDLLRQNKELYEAAKNINNCLCGGAGPRVIEETRGPLADVLKRINPRDFLAKATTKPVEP